MDFLDNLVYFVVIRPGESNTPAFTHARGFFPFFFFFPSFWHPMKRGWETDPCKNGNKSIFFVISGFSTFKGKKKKLSTHETASSLPFLFFPRKKEYIENLQGRSSTVSGSSFPYFFLSYLRTYSGPDPLYLKEKRGYLKKRKCPVKILRYCLIFSVKHDKKSHVNIHVDFENFKGFGFQKEVEAHAIPKLRF